MTEVDRYVDDILDNWNGESTIILGESHINPVHKAIEEELVKSVKPKYLLYEGLKEIDADKFSLNEQPLTLKDLEEEYSIQFPENSECLNCSYEDLIQNIDDSIIRNEIQEFKRPDNKQNLINTPFYRMSDKALRKIKISVSSRLLKEKKEFYRWAEESGFEKDLFNNDQKISKLSETIEWLDSFQSTVSDKRHPILDYIGQQNPNVKMAGADLDPQKEKYLKNIFEQTAPEKSNLYTAMMRDVAMAEYIEKYQPEATEDTNIVILGANHIENVSELTENEVYAVDLSEYIETNDRDLIEAYEEQLTS